MAEYTRKYEINYDYEPNYNNAYDLERETWYKDVMNAYADSREDN